MALLLSAFSHLKHSFLFPQVDGVTLLSIDDQTLAQFVPNLVIVVRYGPSANPKNRVQKQKGPSCLKHLRKG